MEFHLEAPDSWPMSSLYPLSIHLPVQPQNIILRISVKMYLICPILFGLENRFWFDWIGLIAKINYESNVDGCHWILK